MMDIAERLRVRNEPFGNRQLMDDAAAEIERLRTALTEILAVQAGFVRSTGLYHAQEIARLALERTKK